MKKTIIEEYNDTGKLIKRTVIEEDSDKHNEAYNPYNPVTVPLGMKKYLDGTITCQASDATKATLKGE